VLTISPAAAVDIVCAAIRRPEHLASVTGTDRRRLMLFRWVTEEALKRCSATNQRIH